MKKLNIGKAGIECLIFNNHLSNKIVFECFVPLSCVTWYVPETIKHNTTLNCYAKGLFK